MQTEIRVGASPWIGFALDGTRFLRMFWKIDVWTQSATDDPEFVPPSTGHQILHQCGGISASVQ